MKVSIGLLICAAERSQNMLGIRGWIRDATGGTAVVSATKLSSLLARSVDSTLVEKDDARKMKILLTAVQEATHTLFCLFFLHGMSNKAFETENVTL